MTETMTMTDELRVQLRDRTKQQLADAKLALLRYGQLSADIAAEEAAIDKADAEHEQSVAPIQRELKEIDHEQAGELLPGATPNPQLESRRLELLKRLDDENFRLSETCRRHETRLSELKRQRHELAPKMDPPVVVLENKLAGQLARADLKDAIFVAQQSERWAAARLEAAEKMLAGGELRANTAEKQLHAGADTLKARLSKWRAEVVAASETLGEARLAVQRARTEAINE